MTTRAIVDKLLSIQTWKQVAITAVIAGCFLTLWEIYQLSRLFNSRVDWFTNPRILETSYPCNLRQIRSDIYQVSVDVNFIESDINVQTYAIVFTVDYYPDRLQLSNLCAKLIETSKADTINNLLPYQDR